MNWDCNIKCYRHCDIRVYANPGDIGEIIICDIFARMILQDYYKEEMFVYNEKQNNWTDLKKKM